jgi:hypothetical protein
MSTRGSYVAWVVACAAAETVGMTAAAAAARLGQDVVDGGRGRWLALVIVVGGGLVEGTALGLLQGRVLGIRWPSLSRSRFLVATVLVAGVGWAAASAPGVLGSDDSAASPPLGLILLGALGIGLVMGPALGLVQALPLRGVVAHPWRWVSANTAAWPLAMAVIFLGASTAGADWPTLVVAGYGAVTGVLAGAVLGLVSGGWLDSLDGQPVGNRLALALVAGRRLGLHHGLVGLAVTGRRTGQVVRFPVQYALDGDDLVVVPGHAERKSWWRNLQDLDTPLDVLYDGRWVAARAEIVDAGDPGYEAVLAAYRLRWRRSEPSVWEPVVVLHGVTLGIPSTPGAVGVSTLERAAQLKRG